MDIPVSLSLLRIDDWIGEAPLYFCNSEKCILIGAIFGASNIQLGNIFPYAETTKKSKSNASISLLNDSPRVTGLKTGIPSFDDSAETGDASFPLPLLDLLSGWLITPTTSKPSLTIELSMSAEDFGDPANKTFIFYLNSLKFFYFLLFRCFLSYSVSFER